MSMVHPRTSEIRIWKHRVATSFLVGVLLMAGCAVGPKYHRSSVEVPPTYKEADNWKPAQPNELSLRGNWWERFSDAQLNSLEEQVNVSNQNLKAAEAQYTQ